MADRQNNVKALLSHSQFLRMQKDLGSFPAAFFFAKFFATWEFLGRKFWKKYVFRV
jgi:hypothetical protein